MSLRLALINCLFSVSYIYLIPLLINFQHSAIMHNSNGKKKTYFFVYKF